jgi:hypothetical protein
MTIRDLKTVVRMEADVERSDVTMDAGFNRLLVRF